MTGSRTKKEFMAGGDTDSASVVQSSATTSSFNPDGETSMKSSMLISAIVVAALSASPVSAQDRPAPTKPAMNMDRQMSQLHEKLDAMQVQMDTIHKTTDASERRKLMQEHMQAMQESMKTMHGMDGPMLKGGMMKRHEMMGKRLDIMQKMLEQMMQREQEMAPLAFIRHKEIEFQTTIRGSS